MWKRGFFINTMIKRNNFSRICVLFPNIYLTLITSTSVDDDSEILLIMSFLGFVDNLVLYIKGFWLEKILAGKLQFLFFFDGIIFSLLADSI